MKKIIFFLFVLTSSMAKTQNKMDLLEELDHQVPEFMDKTKVPGMDVTENMPRFSKHCNYVLHMHSIEVLPKFESLKECWIHGDVNDWNVIERIQLVPHAMIALIR